MYNITNAARRQDPSVMHFESINPYDGSSRGHFAAHGEDEIEARLEAALRGRVTLRALAMEDRVALLESLAALLRARRDLLADLITEEMGKLRHEARAEVEKCAAGCEYYARQGPAMLADTVVGTDASSSYVHHEPLGTLLAVMPWNFPFWQLFRCAAPAFLVGNSVLLKHAANVPECALAIQAVMDEAGLPEGAFSTLMVPAAAVERLIADPRVHAVTLTGSEAAGRAVAAQAGRQLKKCVLELGGSDPFIVLADADLEATVAGAVLGRYQNAGQSCIAAKRFIVVDEIADEFVAAFREAVLELRPGDPKLPGTTLAPMARQDLRDGLHRQVQACLRAGAEALVGCAPGEGDGAFYAASILDRVQAGMPAYSEELFGPVAAVLRARDEDHAVELANDTAFGLGASIWTADSGHAQRLAMQIRSGQVFINGIVKSDPRLPFGGVRDSGFGRELGWHGLLEFVNAKTVWVR